jgi:hypothetical protein
MKMKKKKKKKKKKIDLFIYRFERDNLPQLNEDVAGSFA